MPLVVTAEDITAALTRTDAVADNIDRAVELCPALDELTRAQWKTWLGAYRAFSTRNKGLPFFTLGLPAIGDQAVAYEHELGAWNQTIAKSCANPQPAPMAHDDVAARNAEAMARALPLPSPDGTTKLLIGGGIVLGIIFFLRR